jgi:hypothetical protein
MDIVAQYFRLLFRSKSYALNSTKFNDWGTFWANFVGNWAIFIHNSAILAPRLFLFYL